MAGDTRMILEYLDSPIGEPDVHPAADQPVRHRVKGLVDFDVIIRMNLGFERDRKVRFGVGVIGILVSGHVLFDAVARTIELILYFCASEIDLDRSSAASCDRFFANNSISARWYNPKGSHKSHDQRIGAAVQEKNANLDESKKSFLERSREKQRETTKQPTGWRAFVRHVLEMIFLIMRGGH